ncbi:MAG: 2Fe-2S iron-sulfur cluster-binding protein [Sinimarinibacterium sp.]|jgi:hypothetical protein
MSAGWLAIVVFAAITAQAVLLAGWALARRWLQRRGANAQGSDSGPAWQGWRRFRVARTNAEDAAGTIRSFYLQPVDGQPLPPFRAGQYLTIQLGDKSSDMRGAPIAQPIVRCYSLSDVPCPEHYRISVKRVATRSGQPAGKASRYLHERIREGDEVSLRAPSGHFVVDLQDHRPPVLVGAGVGITPIWSMLKMLLSDAPKREVWFVYGARSGREHPFRSELAELRAAHPGLHAVVAYSRPDTEDRADVDYRAKGHVDIDLLKRLLPDQHLPFYVCGPGALMESLMPALRAWGVPEALIHYEAFGPASLSAAPEAIADTSTHLVTFSKSQRTVSWTTTDRSLLDLAERNGIDMPSGCRAGSCGSCQTPVETGIVSYRQSPEYPVETGCCLPCVSRPASDLVLGA